MADNRVPAAVRAGKASPSRFRHPDNLAWPKGATEQAVDLALPRGVLIRGKVTEEGTGQPVADTLVSFVPSVPRPARTGSSGLALTKPDGAFAFAVGPHPGHLSVQAPSEDYQIQVISSARFYGGNRGCGTRLYVVTRLRPPRVRDVAVESSAARRLLRGCETIQRSTA